MRQALVSLFALSLLAHSTAAFAQGDEKATGETAPTAPAEAAPAEPEGGTPAEPETTEPETAKPETAKPETAKPEPAKPAEAPAKRGKAAKKASDGFGDLPAWEPLPGNEPVIDAKDANMSTSDWDANTSPAMQTSFPWVENHGYYRFRTDLFHNFDLDTYSRSLGYGTSPVLPPLTELDQTGSGHPEQPDHRYHSPDRAADSQAGANMRFRYQPTLHVAETLRIRATIDILDNVVLGSTPDGGLRGLAGRPDTPLETFSGSARPPESGVNSFQDSVRVKQLWGEWKTPVALVQLGRVPSHWGLGVLANNGHCLDCDFGDNVDRMLAVTKVFGTYLALGWDFPAEGFVGQSGVPGFPNHPTNRTQPFGQPFDYDQRDDVNQWVIAIFQRPLSEQDKAERAKVLNEDRVPVFDWGTYNVIRSQVFSSIQSTYPPEDVNEEVLNDVKAFAFIPDVWLRLQHAPKRDHFYRVELEAVGIFGVIEELPQRVSRPKDECLDESIVNIDDCPAADLIHPRRRTISQWGYALEFDHRIDKLKWGLRQGVASGDKTDGFGVLDRTPLDPANNTDQAINNFKFDRDYILDLILFRELIGAVTNAVYFRPYLSYDLIRDEKEAWGFEIAAEYAFALEATATPGDDSQLGLEFDMQFYIQHFDVMRWSLAYGILFPFAAFDLLDPDEQNLGNRVVLREPSVAQTIQMFVGMQF